MKESITVREAQEVVLNSIQSIGVEKVGLMNALHRILAEDMISSRHVPLHDNSAMDGYALRHADIAEATVNSPRVLKVKETVRAGKRPEYEVEAGEAIKIMTGAQLPSGADTVVRIEDTDSSDTSVKIYRAPKRGSNVRKRGEDIACGEHVLSKNTFLRSAELGILASIGKSQVLVYQKPRVAILATGDEIADPGDPDAGEKIMNSNSYTLAGQIIEANSVPILLGVARDDPVEINRRIESGLQADVLLTSGGVSVGDFDYVRDCLENAGFTLQFWTVAMRPGSPVTFGTVKEKPVFSLPGNPVASMVTFEIFVRPALLKMNGFSTLFRTYVKAVFQEELKKRRGVRTFLRGILCQHECEATVTTTGPQGSGILRSMDLANCLIDVPEEIEVLHKGDPVQVIPLY